MGLLGRIDGVRCCHFSSVDVVRHPLVRRIVEAYDVRDARQVSRVEHACQAVPVYTTRGRMPPYIGRGAERGQAFENPFGGSIRVQRVEPVSEGARVTDVDRSVGPDHG